MRSSLRQGNSGQLGLREFEVLNQGRSNEWKAVHSAPTYPERAIAFRAESLRYDVDEIHTRLQQWHNMSR